MISAKIIADTICKGVRITSMELVMPRFILAQFNTHRVFSRSTASSRAIPTAKIVEEVQLNPVVPIHWGANQPGMQAKNEITDNSKLSADQIWLKAANNAVASATYLSGLGVHKQVVNRILEPFMRAKTIVTATEWDNFFALRLHEDSQPEMQELARCMKQALDDSQPESSDWHLPYILESDYEHIDWVAMTTSKIFSILGKLSAARCARVSYNNHGTDSVDVEKDLQTAERLLAAGHMSPFEHQAVSIIHGLDVEDCRNFRGWRQNRAIIESENLFKNF